MSVDPFIEVSRQLRWRSTQSYAIQFKLAATPHTYVSSGKVAHVTAVNALLQYLLCVSVSCATFSSVVSRDNSSKDLVLHTYARTNTKPFGTLLWFYKVLH